MERRYVRGLRHYRASVSLRRQAIVHAGLILCVLPGISCSADRETSATPSPEGAEPVSKNAGEFEGTGDEYLAALATCLTDAGWKAVVKPDGGLAVDSVAADQREAFMAAKDGCQQSLGLPPQDSPLTPEEIGRIYDYFVGDLTRCVVRLGYAVGQPPSRETFIANYYAADVDLWSPYDVPAASPDVSEEDWMSLNAECPQNPPESG